MIVYKSIGGMMPNQAEGTVDGHPFYFRARWGSWDIHICKPGVDPVLPSREDTLYYNCGDDDQAGWWDDNGFQPFVDRLLHEFESGKRGVFPPPDPNAKPITLEEAAKAMAEVMRLLKDRDKK